jgi:parallel beta-helix repeat protein
LLNNDAQHNVVEDLTIDLRNLTTSNSHTAGIAIANAVTTNITNGAGNNGSFNTLRNNRILGPTTGGLQFGIAVLGTSNANMNAVGNVIEGNIIQDFYFDGIYVENTDGTIVRGNDISRPNKVTNTTFYGIRFINDSKNSIVEQNRIHASLPSSSFLGVEENGIRFSEVRAPVGEENIVRNNAIYDFYGTVSVSGIICSGCQGAFFLHNTIVVEGPGNNIDAIGFNQIGTVANTRFINNIVYMNRRGATSDNIAVRIPVASDILVDRNVYFFGPDVVANRYVGRFSTSSFATLADWQTANGGAYDANSAFIDPLFTDPSPAVGNFLPTESTILALGTNLLAFVTNDILNNSRPASPTPGAWQEDAILTLPLASFTAERTGQWVDLAWQLATQPEQLAGYWVERRLAAPALPADAHLAEPDFARRGWVGPASPQQVQFTYRDQLPSTAGEYRYRLAAQRFDGQLEYSPERSVRLTDAGLPQALQAWPNPVRTGLHLQLPADYQAATLTLEWLDLAGRVLHTVPLPAANQREVFVARPPLTPSLYALRVRTPNAVAQPLRLVVE